MSEKYPIVRLGVAVFVSLLTSATVALFTRSTLLEATRWGWLIFFFYLTWEVIYSEACKKYALNFRGLYGGIAAMSYILVPLCFAVLGLVYWIGINKIYNVALPKNAPVSAAISNTTLTPIPANSPTQSPTQTVSPRPPHAPKSTPSPIQENVVIQTIRIEGRLTCELRPGATIPPAEIEHQFLGGEAHIQGAAGDVALSLLSPIRFRRQGEDQIVVINQFALPASNDLYGQPLASLKNFDVLRMPVSTVVYSNDLLNASLYEVVVSINGHEMWYYSYPFHAGKVQDQEGHTIQFTIPLAGLKKKSKMEEEEYEYSMKP
jgi:hypothetical protein